MNIYWPIYLNIENEINRLMYAIHMDDSHLSVHSSIISDLILRCCAEIESLAKELYKNNGGSKKSGIKYDYDALKFLDDNWKLSKKKVLISSINCFFTNKELTPFTQDTYKTDNPDKLTYLWNNAYQNLKHDRRNGLQHGNVAALFSAAAALFILNVYYKDLHYDLGEYGFFGPTISLDMSQGSSIFSVNMHYGIVMDETGTFYKQNDYDESIYTSIILEHTATEARDALAEEEEYRRNRVRERLIAVKDTLLGKSSAEIQDLASGFYKEVVVPREITDKKFLARKKVKVQAVLNKNQF